MSLWYTANGIRVRNLIQLQFNFLSRFLLFINDDAKTIWRYARAQMMGVLHLRSLLSLSLSLVLFHRWWSCFKLDQWMGTEKSAHHQDQNRNNTNAKSIKILCVWKWSLNFIINCFLQRPEKCLFDVIPTTILIAFKFEPSHQFVFAVHGKYCALRFSAY